MITHQLTQCYDHINDTVLKSWSTSEELFQLVYEYQESQCNHMWRSMDEYCETINCLALVFKSNGWIHNIRRLIECRGPILPIIHNKYCSVSLGTDENKTQAHQCCRRYSIELLGKIPLSVEE